MDFLPVFLTLKNKSCLVVGGGEVATRKITMLLRAGARVYVVARQLNSALTDFCTQQRIEHLGQDFQPIHLTDFVLVIAATDDDSLNQLVSQAAQERNIPVNVVDNPQLCTFIMPSIVDRSPLLIAISSGGQAPVLARLLRAQLETWIPSAYSRLAKVAGKFRDPVKQHFKNTEKRRFFWENIARPFYRNDLIRQRSSCGRLFIAVVTI